MINHFFKLITIIILLNILNNSNWVVEGKKLLIFENYESDDCSGKPIIFRAALLQPDYCFRMLWVESLKMVCDKSQMNNTWADCYASPCDCQSDDCRKYYNLNVCQNGTRITYSNLNYLEKDYCVVSESNSKYVPLDRWRSMGALVVKNNYCWQGIKLECNLLQYDFVECDTNKQLLNAYTLTMGLLRTDAGNISFYFGDSNFMISPIYNNSNSIISNIRIIFYNYLYIIILFLILKILI